MSKGTSSPGPSLPARPDLEWYRKAARKKLKQLRARDSKARLADAQLAIAREHGFASWRKLKAAIESPGGAKAPAVFSAVESGNLAEVRRLLDRGADFEARGEAGNIGRCTPLHLACFLGSDRDAMVRLLLERGADPNVTSSEGCTPLFDAVRHDQRAIADALLADGARATIFEAVGLDRPDLVEPMLAADPDAIARKHPYTKVTPWAFARSQRMRELLRATGAGPTIHEAAELGWTDEVRRQLDRAPALVDSRSEKGQTPLHHAVDWNRIETARLLLERGADPLAPWTPGPGWTALQLSEQRNRAEMIELIKSHKISMSVDTQTVLAALMKAIASRNFDAVKTLAGKVPSLLNMTGPHPMWGGRPQPLHVSIETGALEIFQLLLDSGADPSGDNREYDGWSPLMLAVHWKRDAMRDELLRRGARVGLIEALMLGDDSRLRAILRNEPEALKHPIPNNATPLHFAQTTRAARMLLEAGVKPDARDKYGRTAIESIAGRGKQSKRLVQSLSTATGAAPAPRTLAAVGDLAQLRKAAAKDAKIVHDPEVLHDAIEHGHLPIVRWLLDAGADVNARTARGSKATPLHAAAWHGNLPVVKLLVDRGADLVAVDEQYKTSPATWARTALERLDRTSCLDVAEFLEHSASSEDGAAQRLVRAMERAQFESPAFIDRHFDYAGATPRWEPLEIQSPTLRESEADKAITKFAQLGPHRLLSVWMQVEVASDGRITALPNSPPTRTVEYFRGGEAGQRPRGGQWRHLDWAPTRRGWARNPGAWDDLAEAIALLRSRNLPPGRYRVVTLRRMLHARHEKGQLKIIKKHSYGPNLQGPS